MINNKYTPKEIAESSLLFSIPLYQRLFEWERDQIEKLLNDLKLHFIPSNNAPYYIGMLTTHIKKDSKRFDLVDGQQRFTVMLLLAIAFNWKEFSLYENEFRLDFFARPNDKAYLSAKTNGTIPVKIHQKMELGLGYISEFMQTNFETEEQRSIFKDKIYTNLTFFFSELPSNYNIEDLNRYFEMMNSAGKNLEKYEILKVKLLKQSNSEDQEEHTKIWNLVEQMNRSTKSNKNDDANNECGNIPNIHTTEKTSIDAINASQKRPSNCNENEVEGKRSILNFSEFLLLVLDITLGKNGKYEFYRTDKLLENFIELNSSKDVKRFYSNLLKYRNLFDSYIIKIETDSKGNKYDFEYRFKDEESSVSKDCINQYQSMLYVSTPYYNWLRDILVWLEANKEVRYNLILQKLKDIDNSQRSKTLLESNDDMYYGKIERYWFWRLDYYLWEEEVSNKETAEIDQYIKNYIFRTNRSIEHLHPQNQNQNTKWNEQEVNSFGNLAMISASFNSTQSNDNVIVKFARIKEQIESNSLESIKLYKMYKLADNKDVNWDTDLMNKHQIEMIQVLIQSFVTISE